MSEQMAETCYGHYGPGMIRAWAECPVCSPDEPDAPTPPATDRAADALAAHPAPETPERVQGGGSATESGAGEREEREMDPFTRIVQINAQRGHFRAASSKIVALAPDHLDGRDVNVVLSHLHREIVDAYMVLLPYFAARESAAATRARAEGAEPLIVLDGLLRRWETTPALRRGHAAVEVRRALGEHLARVTRGES